MLCPKYQQPRQHMLDSLIDTFLGLSNLNDTEKFTVIIKRCDYEATIKMLVQMLVLPPGVINI